MGIEGNENSTFPISSERKRISPSMALHQLLRAESDTLDCHSPPAKKHHVFDFKDLCDPEDDQPHGRNELGKYVDLNGNGSRREWE